MPPGPKISTCAGARFRVVLAHESPAARRAIRNGLEQELLFEVVGEAGKSREAIDLFFKLLPDAVVVSAALSDQGGFEVLRCIKGAVARCAVILAIQSIDPFVAEAARALGAAGVCAGTDQPRVILRMLGDIASEHAERQA